MQKSILVFLFVSGIFAACDSNSSNKKVLSDSVGAINSINLVIDLPSWNSAVGDTLRKHFAAPVDGLPWNEPLFNIHQIKPELFTNFARNSRAIILVKKGEKNSFKTFENVYAKPQIVAEIQGTDEAAIIEQIQQNAARTIEKFKNAELAENQKRLLRALNKDKAWEDVFGVQMRIPSYYKVVKQEDKFIWIERQIKKGTMGIIAYELPSGYYKSQETYANDIFRVRDSIGQRFIPGPDPEKHYMISERDYIPFLGAIELDGVKGAEMKAMWEMHGYPMAGPFVHYILNDKENNRILVIEGFMFAPQVEKRNFMFELEAIIKSVKFSRKS